jgi:O-antigen ligase
MIWQAGLGWMQWEYYPFGYGLGTFQHHSLEFFQFANGVAWGAHNVYVQWFFETGVVGVACAAWLYYRLLNQVRTRIKEDKLGTVMVLAVVVEYLVVSYSDNMLDYLPFNWYYWFLLGTACSIVAARQAKAPAQAKGPLNAGFPIHDRHVQLARKGHS